MAGREGELMSRRRWRVGLIAAVALLAALASAEVRRIFEQANAWGLAVLVCLACGLVGIALRTSLLRVRAPAQVVVVLVMSGLAVSSEGGRVPGDLLTAPVKGLTDVLGARWPVPVTAAAMGFVVLVCGAVAAVSVELANRARHRVLLILPSAALLGLVALLSAPAGPPRRWAIGAFGLLSVFVLWAAHQLSLLASRPAVGVPRVAMGRRNVVPVGAATVAAVGLFALGLPLLIGPVLRAPKRYDPRSSQVLRPNEVEDISPLARLDEFRSRVPADTLFTADGGGFARWRLVGLTRYDGEAWMPSADFRPTGRNFDAVQTDSVRVNLSIDALRERWVPWPGELDAVSARVDTDGASAGVLLSEPTTAGEKIALKVRRRPPVADPSQLVEARVTKRPSALTKAVDLPSSMTVLALDITQGATSAYERALRIESYLKTKYQLDSQSIPGHTLALLQVFLDQTRRGRDEQFVAAFGVLAAAVGLPVRVVVGFDTQPDAATGAVTVTSKEIAAWPEVEFVGLGWIAFNPVPSVESPPEAASGVSQDALDQSNAGAARLSPPSTAPTAPPPSEAPTPPETKSDRQVSRTVVGVAAGTLVPLLLVITYVVAVLGLKRRRRRRLRDNGPSAARVSGAFASAFDVVVDLGGQARESLTDSELVDRAPPTFVASGALDTLARRSTTATFGPRPPEEVDADDAWADAGTFAAEVATRVGRLRWLRARLSLRSLRRGLQSS